jgi:hypothetical protein
MWISREEYEILERTAENNKDDANMFRQLVEHIHTKKNVICSDFVFTSRDVWDQLMDKFNSAEDEIKDIKAELEWYKVKYHEMKRNT